MSPQVKVTSVSGLCAADSIEASCAARSARELSLEIRLPLAINSGDRVVLTGAGFNKAMSATIGGIPVRSLEVTSPNSASLVVPDGVSLGMAEVKLSLSGTEVAASLAYKPADGIPLMTVVPSNVCSGVEFYDIDGTKMTGTKDCQTLVVGPMGPPGASAPVAFGAQAGAPADAVYVNSLGYLGIGTILPTAPFHLAAGEVAESTCNSWSSSCITVPSPMLIIGGGSQLKTNTGIHSMLHINAWTPYRGHDSGGGITMGTPGGLDTMNTNPSMKTRISTQTDVGNSHSSRLRFQTTKALTGWNEGLVLWEDGSASLGSTWVGAVSAPGASLVVRGVSNLPLLNLTAQSDGASKVLVDSGGKLGIGISAPARSLHIGDAMRLQPIASPPTSPSNGDFYFDNSDALCVKVTAGWTKLAGSGSCD